MKRQVYKTGKFINRDFIKGLTIGTIIGGTAISLLNEGTWTKVNKLTKDIKKVTTNTAVKLQNTPSEVKGDCINGIKRIFSAVEALNNTIEKAIVNQRTSK
ncbi:hypothetical protein C3744_26390 [Priestia megaterium]|uniref:YtxH domain-containing protein n=1 Tax=Priestia megaterium TaxID=1404 RepID=A0A3D8WV20_PRIMG|nr:hypothetical protein [Priestia megaterium]MDH3174773.1 hypothetical protein [Priestia megaterium]RDZ08131.1 hypothetical protein C3744_26390 [Priestia megaterium]